jgi:diguanylate cyclase (GGDEF)-like protein/PAS domain S-box-containing protein
MTDRAELMEAALDSRPDGIALLGPDGEVLLWNRAAEAITGYVAMELLSRPVPAALEPLLRGTELLPAMPSVFAPQSGRGALVEAHHKMGHTVQAMAQRVPLRDALGECIGTAVFFHPVQSLDALPHGETADGEAEELHASQAELEERLQAEYDDFARGGPPFGVLWMSVDQAEALRKTHGAVACHSMLDKVRRAVAQGLRPGDQLGQWGDGEFLVLAHERSAEMLATHAQTLVGLARTADFRWWGDRVSITVSIGAAQTFDSTEETLAQLLERAHHAMDASHDEGGNRPTLAARRQECLPS